MEIRRSPALAGMVRELYQAMGSGDADAVEGFYSLSPHAVFLRPTIELAGGGRFETRLTFVLHRQDGTWRIVHAHTWVGVEQEG
jgi:hypothetical protein